jgi:hypothetical protein
MKRFAALLIFFAAIADAGPKVDPKLAAVGNQLRSLDCPFLVQAYHPTDPTVNPFGFCLYTLKVEAGIFAQTACVGVLVEPQTLSRNSFYGRNGHWGMEGECTAERIRKKFLDPEIDKTVNPITSLRIKRQEGMQLRMLRDKFGIWDLFEKRTEPEKKAEKVQSRKLMN